MNVKFVCILAFYGYTSNSIIYDGKEKTWTIVDALPDSDEFNLPTVNVTNLAIFQEKNLRFTLPTGLHLWNVNETNCLGERELILTMVSTFSIETLD